MNGTEREPFHEDHRCGRPCRAFHSRADHRRPRPGRGAATGREAGGRRAGGAPGSHVRARPQWPPLHRGSDWPGPHPDPSRAGPSDSIPGHHRPHGSPVRLRRTRVARGGLSSSVRHQRQAVRPVQRSERGPQHLRRRGRPRSHRSGGLPSAVHAPDFGVRRVVDGSQPRRSQHGTGRVQDSMARPEAQRGWSRLRPGRHALYRPRGRGLHSWPERRGRSIQRRS